MKKVSSLLIVASLAFASPVLYAPEASPQVGRVIMQSMDDVIRAISRGAPKVVRQYRVVNLAKTSRGVFVTTVQTVGAAGGAYVIYVDCKSGTASKSLLNLPQEQRISLVRDICAGQLR